MCHTGWNSFLLINIGCIQGQKVSGNDICPKKNKVLGYFHMWHSWYAIF